MRTRVALGSTLAIILATLVVGASASANYLSVSEDQFELRFSAVELIPSAGSVLRCPVTLAGSFHERVIEKVEGSLIGHVDEAVIRGGGGAGECTGGTATFLSGSLPWHVTYDGFTGELPNIESVRLSLYGFAFEIINALGLNCLARTTLENPLAAELVLSESGQAPLIALDETSSIPAPGGDGSCAFFGVEFRPRASGGVEDRREGLLFVELSEIPPTPPPEPNLETDPTSVVVERGEASDTFTLRNVGNQMATLSEPQLEGVNREAPEFSVSSSGCGSTLAEGASCTYTIRPLSRPLEGGRVTVPYEGDERHAVEIAVELQGEDIEAVLTAEPSSATIEALEQNDIVEIANLRNGLTATIDRVTTTTTDTESPEFSVVTTGCRERLALNERCHYLISVNSRPETSGRITVEYDDGTGASRRLVIEVDIVGPDPGELQATPTRVDIERLESNDSFVIRNISPDTAVVVDRPTLVADDRERPEFSVTGIGCPEIFIAGASCTYIVSVNSRPEADGTYTLEYDDGAGGNRRVTVDVDIAS